MNTFVWTRLESFLADNIIVVFLAIGILIWNVAQWKSKVDGGMDKIASLSDKIDRLYEMLYNQFGPHVLGASSPVALTEYGKDLARQTDAESLAIACVEKVREKVSGMSPYQIQKFSLRYAHNELLEDLKNGDMRDRLPAIENVAYEKGIDIEAILQAVGILLRDALLRTADQSKEGVNPQTSKTP